MEKTFGESEPVMSAAAADTRLLSSLRGHYTSGLSLLSELSTDNDTESFSSEILLSLEKVEASWADCRSLMEASLATETSPAIADQLKANIALNQSLQQQLKTRMSHILKVRHELQKASLSVSSMAPQMVEVKA